MDGLQQHGQQQQQRVEEQQQFEGQHHQQHGQQIGQQGEVNRSPGVQGQQGGQQGAEVSQLDFEDALGARLMESLEDHDKRAASVTTS
ncbi:hypothetical protein V491_01880 [Pseudogymnoascus sp. VKM F-3775]|nr:hypothetical protein V491_01880 [Pseudogymnoascus sp. VKM F-3775]